MSKNKELKKEYRELLLGCGKNHSKIMKFKQDDLDEFINLTTLDIDSRSGADVIHDLNARPLPFDDNTFDEIHAYEVLEHLGKQGDWKGFFEEFSEYYRILKPSGKFFATVPHITSIWAWGDPGHTRIFSPQYLVYLSQKQYAQQIDGKDGNQKTQMTDYRDVWKGDFEIRALGENTEVFPGKTFFILEAIKPSRIKEVIKKDES